VRHRFVGVGLVWVISAQDYLLNHRCGDTMPGVYIVGNPLSGMRNVQSTRCSPYAERLAGNTL